MNLVRLLWMAAASSVHAFSPDSSERIPVLFDSSNYYHRDIQYHPEQPARIEACVKALSVADNVQLIDVAEEAQSKSSQDSIATVHNSTFYHQPFSDEELRHARNMLVRAHSEDFVAGIEKRCRDSRQRRIDEGKVPLGFVGYLDDDTYVTTESFDVALRATAAWIRAADIAMEGAKRGAQKDSNRLPVSAAMALTRPPGHHATSQLSNGFCLFNFAAAAAIHILEAHPHSKVSIFDWDVHFGQGK